MYVRAAVITLQQTPAAAWELDKTRTIVGPL